MTYALCLRRWLALGAAGVALAGVDAAAAAPAATVAAQDGTAAAEAVLVVTAQRKAEDIQRTPVAVSAFTGDALKIRRLDGGENLELAVPNMNYSRTYYRADYSLELRGIGAPVVGVGAEPGVSIDENNLPLEANHFADTDFYDTQRLEVVRGPVGTLYGRNATAGAVDIITNQPTDIYEGSITGEFGNFNERKFNGFVNLPVNDALSVRLAGFYLGRDGFGQNSVTGESVDGRNLGSFRATVSYKPNARFSAYLMYEHFAEDDDRNLVGKQLCNSDPGPARVGGVAPSPTEQGFLSQGCQPTSLYSPSAYGAVNTSGTLVGIFGEEAGLLTGNANANHEPQNTNLQDLASAIQPVYRSQQDIVDLHMTWNITDHLALESITGWDQNTYFYERDYDRLVSSVPFNTTPTPGCLLCLASPSYAALYAALFPGGNVSDAQTGATNRARVFDEGMGTTQEITQEFRLISSFAGPINFSAGVNYYQQDASTEYYVFFNSLQAFEQVENTGSGQSIFFIDNNNPPNATGNNYFLSGGSGSIRSYAAFGELYYDITPDLRLTLGLRETDDQKFDYPQLSPLLNPLGGGGPDTPSDLAGPTQSSVVLATTARVNLQWTPRLPFTDQTIFYASYGRGYKGGGFNTACGSSCDLALTFAPEYINAFEIGTKNLVFGDRMTLNLTGFYYDYNGYQISSIVDQAAFTQNVDAAVFGVEFESVWNPTPPLTFNVAVGYLNTRISDGFAVDQANETQGDPNLTLVKDANGENCVVNTQALAGLLTSLTGAPAGVQEAALLGVPGVSGGVCDGQYANTPLAGLYGYAPGEHVTTAGGVGQGVLVNLAGRQLPNAPNWTVSFGAQYVWRLPGEWKATLRGDYYWQDYSYARIFNDTVDYLQAWSNVNMTLTFAKPGWGLDMQLYVKNLTDSQPITSTFLADASAGLFSNTFTLDPRTFGVAVTKKFQ
jgi:outer membrane receptor protein involved in Fe transport